MEWERGTKAGFGGPPSRVATKGKRGRETAGWGARLFWLVLGLVLGYWLTVVD